MLDYFAQNPTITFFLLLLCWPGIFSAMAGYWIGRYGSPIKFKWIGIKQAKKDRDVERSERVGVQWDSELTNEV